MYELNAFKKNKTEKRDFAPDMDSKHLAMLNAIAPYAKNSVPKNLTEINIQCATRKTKLALILMPEWSIMFPPFNLARLSAVAKGAGYETKCIDLNIKSYNYLRQVVKHKTIDFDPWNGTKEWKWIGDSYYTDIHPHLLPLYEEWIDKIVQYNPDLVGFTQYYCNEQPVIWFAKELKKRMPNLAVAVGGPNMQVRHGNLDSVFDYAVTGEGEQLLLEILDKIENATITDNQSRLTQPEDQRLNISGLPMPDYTDFDFNEYNIPNGANSEMSRGCTAKCTFCEETHFWKYRQRMASDVISEVEWMYYNKGTDVVWFIDSLVNGNLKELRAFCKGVVAKDLKIHWTGYARCDGRMDLDYYRDLADSGCFMLNYGIESGSQRVLDDIDKGVTIAEMEQNFRDGKIAGVQAFTNWIVGFPTEQYQDFADTMTFLWRNRNQNVTNIAAGFGFGLGVSTIVGQNPDKFNLLNHKYCDGWITKDFRLSKFHVLYRVKSFAIFLQNLLTDNHVTVPYRPNLPKYHYKIEFDNPHTQREIEYEQFDYNIIKPDISPFADSLVNEIFVLFRMLWRTRGGFKARVVFGEKMDLQEFGDRNAGPMWTEHNFEIDDDGNWSGNFTYKFTQPSTVLRQQNIKPVPFWAQDYSTVKTNAAQRARKLAKPVWGEVGRTSQQFKDLQEEEQWLNNNVNFSFDYCWQGSGSWGGHNDYAVAVPAQHTLPKISLHNIGL